MEHNLIGLPLTKAQALLEEKKINYEVKLITGGNDEELLNIPYVVRVKALSQGLELIVTKFKTTI